MFPCARQLCDKISIKVHVLICIIFISMLTALIFSGAIFKNTFQIYLEITIKNYKRCFKIPNLKLLLFWEATD